MQFTGAHVTPDENSSKSKLDLWSILNKYGFTRPQDTNFVSEWPCL